MKSGRANEWYKLESVSNNQISELTSPISAVEGEVQKPVRQRFLQRLRKPRLRQTATRLPRLLLRLLHTNTHRRQKSAYPGPETLTPTSAYPGIATTVAPVPGSPLRPRRQPPPLRLYRPTRAGSRLIRDDPGRLNRKIDVSPSRIRPILKGHWYLCRISPSSLVRMARARLYLM